ncbi:hypothetical protein O1W71_15135 [Microbacterium sp. H37-C3]|uniref:hypothetical protein n=1 Tax=Microbacterium sp. H37-C3 TaxID=3004354 RepID=UPI0022B016B4|nr:hypothetical protein [Microbacterium sp. H37-C3]MCZ4069010.1 hypothetical protein [Microbacterium sp. H37-C3]
MNRREGILLGFAGLAVAGLVALAMPAVASLADSVGFDPEMADVSAPEAAATESPPLDPGAETTSPVDAEGGIAGYQDVGGGVSIPAKGPGDCPTWAIITPYDAWNPAARLSGAMTDLGPTAYASGEVGLDDDGEIATYAVAAGDTGYGIGDRFCLDYIAMLSYNDKSFSEPELQPGDILFLRP